MQLYYSNAEKLSIFNETIFDIYEEKSFLKVNALASGKILDVGCGTGVVDGLSMEQLIII